MSYRSFALIRPVECAVENFIDDGVYTVFRWGA